MSKTNDLYRILGKIQGFEKQVKTLQDSPSKSVSFFDEKGRSVMSVKGEEGEMVVALSIKIWEEKIANLKERVKNEYGVDLEA